ncbi:uncharacterized protein [Dysidea avara]|uniref:uncharacterized protein isoform X2 n=1 Tax=Dysidea avara TaxID=196820 RepID=UPI0033343D65
MMQLRKERKIIRDCLRANAASLEGVQLELYQNIIVLLKFKKPRKMTKLKKQALKCTSVIVTAVLYICDSTDDLVPLAEGDPSEFHHGSRSTGRRRLYQNGNR